ncbi:lipid droplet-associated protein [Nocardia donostiensis]|uniref:Lipid droplet-associated protein n=1 Tax=Nocardia donostiensis TaxID=1538463 RepID=A0A1W0B3R7_9NOCA|nr:lipid droplet-associated protein [Nocardia donostiensis]ONM50624.1 hypothetical protein B0T46_01615 [Nocardia donostiensis]OQS16520.1 hypothetical protein B0T44_25120 [Nocardia donostiensis]OQS17149.1 hypothetical protein B0T36_00570 [Nocardia donostiensis]
MFRPPFLARVAAGAAVYAIEETRRLPSAAVKFPVTAISQLLQTSMHVQQFVTSLAIKGDMVFERLGARPVEQPEWATFDEDNDPADPADPVGTVGGRSVRNSGFDRFDADPAEVEAALADTLAGLRALQNIESDGSAAGAPANSGATVTAPEPAVESPVSSETVAGAAGVDDTVQTAEVVEPEVAARYDYVNMTLAQLRARLRMLTVDDLTALLEYEQQTRARAPFVTMLTNRIATVRAQ